VVEKFDFVARLEMETFAPEFSQFWRPETAASSGALVAQRDDDTGAQKAALEELAERVSAARSVV
jgi:hypothetical protein